MEMIDVVCLFNFICVGEGGKECSAKQLVINPSG